MWEPPARFAFAWQITPQWQYQQDGQGAAAMRVGVDTEQGWGALMKRFAAAAER